VAGPPPAELTATETFLLIGQGGASNVSMQGVFHVRRLSNGTVVSFVDNFRATGAEGCFPEQRITIEDRFHARTSQSPFSFEVGRDGRFALPHGTACGGHPAQTDSAASLRLRPKGWGARRRPSHV
jgi:hypothetical protein